jgi:GTP-binding protein EngB required for normal cell division
LAALGVLFRTSLAPVVLINDARETTKGDREMLNLFKRKKKPGLIYWVNMDKIVIQPSFLNTQIRP